MSIFDKITIPCESLYDKTADVYVYKKAEGVINNTYEEKLYSDIPCRISVNSSPNGTQTDTTDNVSQSIKLFCSPKYKIPSGSKIIVDDKVFKSSGIPSGFVSHQELELLSEVSRA